VRRQSAQRTEGPSPLDQLPEHQAFAAEFMEREGLEVVATGSPEKAKKPHLPMFSQEFFAAQMEVVIEEKVPVYASGLGDPGPWMEQMRANGTIVMAVVGAVRHAKGVARSDVDVIIAQGHDAGGHNSPVGTMALVPQVVDAVDQPVLAAGGITDGRGVAAALMLGAKGVWIGSAFLATEEANIHDFQKQAIVDASEEGTMVSRSVTGKPARLIRNKWSQAYADSPLEPLPMPFQGIVANPVLAAGVVTKRADIMPGFAGQGIGMIQKVRPAAEVLRDLVDGADAALRSAASFSS
jgi:nitronate monooxygenase